MRVCIHHGTGEIGGTCIEVEAEGKRIALDVGLPLDAPEDGHESLLPAVPGFREPDESLLGVLISHPHQDHYGLARYVRPDVPIWIGKTAHNIMKAASAYVPDGLAFENPRFISDRKPLEIGPFRITPYLVDHSAFDAYAFLIQAGGKRVFYSGDFRAHGRKGKLFEAMIERPPKDIDVLLMEGTTIGADGYRRRLPHGGRSGRGIRPGVQGDRGHSSCLGLRAEHRPHGHDLPRGQANGSRVACRPLHCCYPCSDGKKYHPAIRLGRSEALHAETPAWIHQGTRPLC